MGRVFLSKADVSEVEERYVVDALQSDWITPLGPHVDAFENEIAERVGVAGALAVSSGTAAMHLALLEMGAGPGSFVLLPSLTFVASANAVVYTGATPVFVDSQYTDGNVDPELLVEAANKLLSEGKTIAAVMAVDLFGRCANYAEIEPPLRELGIPLLEDAAEALGARCLAGNAGSFGAAAIVSFNGNKIMTTSGGGMILSDDLSLIERCRHLSTQAREPAPYYQHTEVGYNYRLSNILAALGRGQLVRFDGMVDRRREIRRVYSRALDGIPGVRILGSDQNGGEGRDNCWLTSILLDPAVVTPTVSAVIKALDAADIEARHIWKPMHLQPVFANFRSFSNGTSERLFDQGLCLPSGSGLTDSDITRVIDALLLALGVAE